MNVIDYDEPAEPKPTTPNIPVNIMAYEEFLEKMDQSEKKMEFLNECVKMIKTFTDHYFLPIADRIENLIHSNQ
jgi:hypothetical protein